MISISFNKSIDIIDILNILFFYINNKDCIISKVLLISNKGNLRWYNDITPYINKNLLLLYNKIKSDISENKKNRKYAYNRKRSWNWHHIRNLYI